MTTSSHLIFKRRKRIRLSRYCDSCGSDYFHGPHPETGRVLDYCEHRPDCLSHNAVVDALRRAGLPERDIAETT
jgi:hypothetical protein